MDLKICLIPGCLECSKDLHTNRYHWIIFAFVRWMSCRNEKRETLKMETFAYMMFTLLVFIKLNRTHLFHARCGKLVTPLNQFCWFWFSAVFLPFSTPASTGLCWFSSRATVSESTLSAWEYKGSLS